MNILKLLFGTTGGESPGTPDPCHHTERLEARRSLALRAYSEEHLFGYVDDDGNLNDRPVERLSEPR